MKFASLFALTAFAAIVCLATPAQAQPPFAGTYRQPVLSPYLNLLGNNPEGVSNYFTQVVPQLQNQQNFQQQASQIQRLQQTQNAISSRANTGTNPIGNPEIRATGHAANYMTYSHYYALPAAGRRR